MPTLAELRAQSGPQPLPRTTKVVTLVEGQHLLAEMETLVEETRDLSLEEERLKRDVTRTDGDGEKAGPPRKAGEGAPSARRLEEIAERFTEIEARLAEIPDGLAEFQGDVELVGMTGGDWQRFKDQHPPREDMDETGKRLLNRSDIAYALGLCNSSAVFDALGKFVKAWNGEAVTPTDWDEWLGERIAYADRRDLIGVVVRMHEQGAARSPKSRSASPTTSPSVTG